MLVGSSKEKNGFGFNLLLAAFALSVVDSPFVDAALHSGAFDPFDFCYHPTWVLGS